MRLVATPLEGLLVLEQEPRVDSRGYFARTYSHREFSELGLDPEIAECSTSFNTRAGTLRGLHFQAAPKLEAKLVRCTRGAIFDVAVDLRVGSPTRSRWFGLELSCTNGTSLFIPKGFAHGFQTLTDDAEVYYQISTPFEPSLSGGVRWDDPTLAIDWPRVVSVISDRDRALPFLSEVLT